MLADHPQASLSDSTGPYIGASIIKFRRQRVIRKFRRIKTRDIIFSRRIRKTKMACKGEGAGAKSAVLACWNEVHAFRNIIPNPKNKQETTLKQNTQTSKIVAARDGVP